MSDVSSNNIPNDTRREDFLKKVGEKAKTFHKGSMARVDIGGDLVRATKDKVFTDYADLSEIHDKWREQVAKSKGKKEPESQSKMGKAKEISHLGRFFYLGQQTIFDPEIVWDKIADLWKHNSFKLEAWTAFHQAAKAANDAASEGREPTVDELSEAMGKRQPDDDKKAKVVPTAQKTVERVVRTLEKLVEKDDQASSSPAVTQAIRSLKEFVAQATLAASQEAFRKMATELGFDAAKLVVAPPPRAGRTRSQRRG